MDGLLEIDWRAAYAKTSRDAPYESRFQYGVDADGNFIHNVQGNLISVDQSNGPGFQELYGERLIVINCRFNRNFDPAMGRADETFARADIGGPGGAQRFVEIPTCENQEIEIALGNHPDVLSGSASLGDIVYQGVIR